MLISYYTSRRSLNMYFLPALKKKIIQIFLKILYLEKGMATHSSIVWKILWTEEPGRLQSMELQRVGHD